ncbi:hypothetical protein O7C57_01810 [Providencia sp. 21OH12SH02B-Prov]|nr:hypothetical protein [Providencia sp. 21OH12SH02B-Prov]WBA57360.1 hypothetical protein O7C57_01810 [Providencia sp. 21OH12SH02B-Prov]
MAFFISTITPTDNSQLDQIKFSLKNPILKMVGEKKAREAGFSLLA